MTIEIAAGVYGVMMSLAPILQARRMRQRRSSDDVSIVYLVVLEVGFVLFLAYGLSIGNRVLIATNTVSIAATSLTLVVAALYRSPARAER
jgi:MtN3 and saliva related transmembrane protein